MRKNDEYHPYSDSCRRQATSIRNRSQTQSSSRICWRTLGSPINACATKSEIVSGFRGVCAACWWRRAFRSPFLPFQRAAEIEHLRSERVGLDRVFHAGREFADLRDGEGSVLDEIHEPPRGQAPAGSGSSAPSALFPRWHGSGRGRPRFHTHHGQRFPASTARHRTCGRAPGTRRAWRGTGPRRYEAAGARRERATRRAAPSRALPLGG